MKEGQIGNQLSGGVVSGGDGGEGGRSWLFPQRSVSGRPVRRWRKGEEASIVITCKQLKDEAAACDDRPSDIQRQPNDDACCCCCFNVNVLMTNG